MNIPYIIKKCSKCGRWLVANTDNFYKYDTGKYGLRSQCKKCMNKKHKQYREDNRDKLLEYHKQYRENNKEKIAEQKKQYCENNKEKEAERRKQYYETNKEKEAEQHKQYYEINKEKILEYSKQYRENNKEKIAKYHKRYFQTPQGQVARFNGQQRRRIKEEEQGAGITKEQWLEMMNFFDWRCAYSGEYIGGKQNYQRTIDHIVPLNSGGDNMVWNLVPMTRSLNSSKSTKDMEKWYKEQDFYNPKRLQKIYDWQEYAYNKYGKNTEYFNTNDIQIKLI